VQAFRLFSVDVCRSEVGRVLLIMSRPEHQAPPEVVSTFTNNILCAVDILLVRLNLAVMGISK